MRKFTLFIVLLGSCLISRAQVRPDINSFTPAQRTTLVNLMMDYITPEVLEKHCNYDPTNSGYPNIHSDFSFLRFHHTYLEGMEDYFYLHGHPEFVPLPSWNPVDSAPIEFITCGPLSNGVDADCGAATCNNMGGGCGSINTWDPNIDIASSAYNYLHHPSQPGGNDGICQWPMLFVVDSDANGQTVNNISNKIENPYHGSVHTTMGGVMGAFRSPSAPVFWIWHGFVDDLWKYWQCNCPNSIYNVPVDLYMKDQKEIIYPERDWGAEPNIDQGPMWISSDIWVRNGTDGFTTDVHQNPQYDSTGNGNVHVYVRVRNRGCSDYTGGAQLHLYWAKASTGLGWPNPWDGSTNQPNQPMGEAFTAQAIPAIVAGGQTILEFDWNDVPNPLNYPSLGGYDQHHFCLLGRIVYTNDPMTFPEGNILEDNVRNNNNIVWKNIAIVDENGQTSDGLLGGLVLVGNPLQTQQVFNFNFTNAEIFGQASQLTSEAEVRILMDDALWNAWVAGGSLGTQVKATRDVNGAKAILITGPNASLNNLRLAPQEQYKIALAVNFLSDRSTGQSAFDYDISQERADGKEIGGERFHVIKPERLQRLTADAGNDQEITDVESAQLSAASANEPAVYNWYDQNDSLIYAGTNFTVSPEITTRYKLQLTAQSDGFRDYDSVTIKVKDCYLKNIYPNPVTSSITIEYKTKDVSSAYLTIMQPYGSVSNNYILNLNQTQKTIDLSTLPSGDYSVILVCDGQIVDMKPISKL